MCPTTENKNDVDFGALARRRRKVKLSKKNDNGKRIREEEPDEIISTDCKKPHITGIKHQARYDPGVKMTRVELTAWRKEARRVRNRESAAASRGRTRDKIDELESKLASMEEKYAAALKRITELESRFGKQITETDSEPHQQEDRRENAKEALVKPVFLAVSTSVVSPVLTPTSSPIPSPVAFDLGDSRCSHQVELGNSYQHINMISRPPA